MRDAMLILLFMLFFILNSKVYSKN